jgi:hypothetical protein
MSVKADYNSYITYVTDSDSFLKVELV